MANKRLLTLREEQAYRLVHQDFEGLSKAVAAKKMNIGIGQVRRLLASVRKKAPQLFPILTPLQAKIVKYCEAHPALSYKECAEFLKMSSKNFYSIISRLKRRGKINWNIYGSERNVIKHIASYETFMDDKIVEKF